MKLSGKYVILPAMLVAIAAAVLISDLHRYLTFEQLKQSRDALKFFIMEHYGLSVAVFSMMYMSTAFFLPGALVLSIAAGFLFGVTLGTTYIVMSATIGATLAFLVARYLIGDWIQDRYSRQFRTFNREVSRFGLYYLLILRIVPVLPFFIVNYLAGLTKLPARFFVVATLFGMLPGSLVYTVAGRKLGTIESPHDILSGGVIAAFLLLAVFVMLPVIVGHLRSR